MIQHGLDPVAIGVMALKELDLSEPDFAPRTEDFLRRAERRAVKGCMWEEERERWIATRTNADKERMWKRNLNFHRKRRADSEKEVNDYKKRLRGEPSTPPANSEEESNSDYEPKSVSPVELSPGELRWLEYGC